MNCPKCTLPRTLADRVCRRCKYLFDEDRFIAIEPPRAGVGSIQAARLESKWRVLTYHARSRPWIILLASLIPGLGHLLAGKPRRGLYFFALVGVLTVLSVSLGFSSTGRILFGLAVSAHAYSIFDLTEGARSPDLRRRALTMGAILVLLFVIYWPLIGRLADMFVAPERTANHPVWGGMTTPMFEQLIFIAILFAVSLWISHRLSSRKSRGGA